LAGGLPSRGFEHGFRFRDGSYRWLSWVAVATQRLATDPTPLSVYAPGVSGLAERAVMRALAREQGLDRDGVAGGEEAVGRIRVGPVDDELAVVGLAEALGKMKEKKNISYKN